MAKLVFGMNQSLDGYVDHRRAAGWLVGARRGRCPHGRGEWVHDSGRRLRPRIARGAKGPWATVPHHVKAYGEQFPK